MKRPALRSSLQPLGLSILAQHPIIAVREGGVGENHEEKTLKQLCIVHQLPQHLVSIHHSTGGVAQAAICPGCRSGYQGRRV